MERPFSQDTDEGDPESQKVQKTEEGKKRRRAQESRAALKSPRKRRYKPKSVYRCQKKGKEGESLGKGGCLKETAQREVRNHSNNGQLPRKGKENPQGKEDKRAEVETGGGKRR